MTDNVAAGTVVLSDKPVTTDGASGSSAGGPSAGTNGDAAGSAAERKATLTKLLGETPSDELIELLSANPELQKQATRTIRQADIRRHAESLAEKRTSELLGESTQEITTLRAQVAELKAAMDAGKLENMNSDERAAYTAQQQLVQVTERLKNFERIDALRDADDSIEAILGMARDEWGFDDGEIKELRKTAAKEPPAKFMSAALKLASARAKKLNDDHGKKLDDLSTKLAALERGTSGVSTFAATTPAATGGGMDDEAIIKAYSENPGDYKTMELYRAYVKRQRDQGKW